MKPRNIWFCGYREWALEIHSHASRHVDYPIPLLRSQEEFEEHMAQFGEEDLFLFIGWSWIIPKSFVDTHTCICLHPSPLPKYRGGSPLQHQIIRGEEDSAVTFFLMDEYLDKGPILFVESFSLAGSLDDIYKRITKGGKRGIEYLTTNYLKRVPLGGVLQDESQKSYFKRRTPEMSEIKAEDFANLAAIDVYNKVRALQDPYPNAFIRCKDNTRILLKIVEVERAT